MSALAKLREQGLTAEARVGRLIVRPRERLTDELRAYIRVHKPAILAELQGRDIDTDSMAAIDPSAEWPDPLQARALKMLDDDAGIKHAFATDGRGDPVTVAVAIRGVGAGTLLIPAEKWDPFKFLEIVHRKQEDITCTMR